MNYKHIQTKGYDSSDSDDQKFLKTLPKTPINNRASKQDAMLRDLLLKYQVIEQDDSKFNFRYDEANSFDSQKSKTFSQYKRSMLLSTKNIEDSLEKMQEEKGNSSKSQQDKCERKNFCKNLSFSFLQNSQEKKFQNLFTPKEDEPTYKNKHNNHDKKQNDQADIWNTNQESDNKKRRYDKLCSSTSYDTSSSLEKKNGHALGLQVNRQGKRPLTSQGQQAKKTKNTQNVGQKLEVGGNKKKNNNNNNNNNQAIDNNKPLHGKSIFVDVYTNDGEHISESFQSILTKLGADIKKKISSKVDFLIWKDGSNKNYEKAENSSIPILSIHWLEKCHSENRLIETSDEYLVQRPTKMVTELSTRVDKIYQKYVHHICLIKQKEKEIKKKVKQENLIIYKNNEDEEEEDEILNQLQKTLNYQILNQKQLKGEIRGQEELEQYYHDIIQECYEGKFSQKWKKRNIHEPLITKYEPDYTCIDFEQIFEKQQNQFKQNHHSSRVPQTEDIIICPGLDSKSKQQKTMQDFFCLKKVIPSNPPTQFKRTPENNKDNNQFKSQDIKHINRFAESKINNRQNSQSNDSQFKKDSVQKIKIKEFEKDNDNQINQSQKGDILNINQNIQKINLSSISKINNERDDLSQKSPFSAKSPFSTKSPFSVKAVQFSDMKSVFSSNKLITPNVKGEFKKNSMIDDLTKKKAISSTPCSLQTNKKKLCPKLNQNGSLMRFGFSLKKADNMVDEQQNQPKALKIGYINLSQNQILQLQQCKDNILTSYELCGEKEYFTEDVLIVGNPNINSQHQNGVVKSQQTLNQLRILSLLINNQDVVSFKWIEDCIESQTAKPSYLYQEFENEQNKNLFTGFTFSLYLDQLQRKVPTVMAQKQQIENVIHYFGGKVLENTKSAQFIIFFKQCNKVPPGYDPEKCINDKWIYDSIFKKELVPQGLYKIF